MKTTLASALIAALMVVAVPAHAEVTNLVNDGSFEAFQLNSGSWTIVTSNSSSWSFGNAGYEIRNNVAGAAQDGNIFVELDTTRNSWISQSFSTVAGQNYDLSFWYAPRVGVPSDSNGIDVSWNNSTVLSVTGNGNSSTAWTKQTYQLVGTGGTDKLTFAAAGYSNSLGGSIDNVSLTAAVPEPETYAMLLAGLGLMGAIARRRKARQA